MADGVQFDIRGLDAVEAKMKALSKDAKYKGGRFALRKSANLVRDDAKRRAERFDDPETGRKIADNVAVRWSGRYFKQTGDLKFRVGVRGGGSLRRGNPDTGPGGATPHWHLLELGTEDMAAQPFLRPALAENVSAVTNEFVSQYSRAIDRALRRAAKGQG